MKLNRGYKIGQNLSLLYVVYTILCLFLGIGFLSDLFLIIVFPIVLFQLKHLIVREYNYSLGLKFNIIIIVVFISKALPLLGSIILSTFVDFSAFSGALSGNYTSVPSNVPYTELVMVFAYMIELLTIIRGVALIILGMLLLKKINDFRKTMKIAIISMLILGIHTFLIGAIQLFYYYILQILSTQIITIITRIIAFSLLVIFISLFGSLYSEFKSANNIVECTEAT